MNTNEQKKDHYDHIVKIILLGDSSVGKTNIFKKFTQHKLPEKTKTTIGFDVQFKVIQVDNKKIKLSIWDTAGQDQYKNVSKIYYQGALGVVLIYSIADRLSFKNIENWMEEINQYSSESIQIILVGNKNDKARREITFEEGQKIADFLNVQFFEISAREDQSLDQIFIALAKQIKIQVLDKKLIDRTSFKVDARQSQVQKQAQMHKRQGICC